MIAKAQSLDNFIDKSLYEKNRGYYQKKMEFGRRGDFVTSPGISKLFSEMIAIWVVSFWENLNKPEKINLVELNFIPDAIIYLAAISNDPMGKQFSKLTHEINTRYCEKIAKQAKKIGVRKFIFASSCSIYGAAGNTKKKETHKISPLTDYAKSKVNSENKLKKLSDNKFKVISLRFPKGVDTK